MAIPLVFGRKIIQWKLPTSKHVSLMFIGFWILCNLKQALRFSKIFCAQREERSLKRGMVEHVYNLPFLSVKKTRNRLEHMIAQKEFQLHWLWQEGNFPTCCLWLAIHTKCRGGYSAVLWCMELMKTPPCFFSLWPFWR